MMSRKVLVSFMILILSGCGGGSGSGGGYSSSDPLEINGIWVSNCYFYDNNEYIIDRYEFFGFLYSSDYHVYDNSGCLGSAIRSSSFSGEIEIGKAITAASGLRATEIKFIFDLRGARYQILDIIRVVRNEFVLGIGGAADGEYPDELDFDIIFSRQ